MKVSDLFSNSLEAKLARFYAFHWKLRNNNHFIYGTVEKGFDEYCRGVVYAYLGTNKKKEIWRTDLHLDCRFAIEEMRREMNKAADRFEFIFKIMKTSHHFDYDEEIIRDDFCE